MQRSRPTSHLFENRAAKEKERLEVLTLELGPGPLREEILEMIRELDASAAPGKEKPPPV